jgi:putative transposase
MKGTRHSEEQIIEILKQGEAGLTTAEFDSTGSRNKLITAGRRSTAGWTAAKPRSRTQLEDENRKLKHVVADLTLDNRALKDVLSKNW